MRVRIDEKAGWQIELRDMEVMKEEENLLEFRRIVQFVAIIELLR